MDKNVSKATLQRYPIYLKALRKLKSMGVERIMSKELSEFVDIQPTTIRRDFSLIGHLGKQGYGYNVDQLIEIFSNKLGVNFDEKIILVGAGNFGRAVLNYNRWDNIIGKIICVFDKHPENIQGLSVPVYNIDQINEKMPEGCKIAIVTMSNQVQETVDLLIENGIEGIVDLTRQHFSVPNNVCVRSVDIISTIIELVYEINRRDIIGE